MNAQSPSQDRYVDQANFDELRRIPERGSSLRERVKSGDATFSDSSARKRGRSSPLVSPISETLRSIDHAIAIVPAFRKSSRADPSVADSDAIARIFSSGRKKKIVPRVAVKNHRRYSMSDRAGSDGDFRRRTKLIAIITNGQLSSTLNDRFREMPI